MANEMAASINENQYLAASVISVISSPNGVISMKAWRNGSGGSSENLIQ